MSITSSNLRKWQQESMRVARIIGLKSDVLDMMEDSARVQLTVADSIDIGMLILFGACHYYSDKVHIEVLRQNLADGSASQIRNALEVIGLSGTVLDEVMTVYQSVSPSIFREILNQSGMDHELIGHGYNYLAKEDFGEQAAVTVQLAMAEFRAKTDISWKAILPIMPIVLYQLKRGQP